MSGILAFILALFSVVWVSMNLYLLHSMVKIKMLPPQLLCSDLYCHRSTGTPDWSSRSQARTAIEAQAQSNAPVHCAERLDGFFHAKLVRL